LSTTTAYTTWPQTFTAADLERLEQELALMPKPQWALIAPDGRTWMDADPQALLRVLALQVYANAPLNVAAPSVGPQEQGEKERI
jgi:hypothetical protein